MTPAKIDRDHDQAQVFDAYADSMIQLGLVDHRQDATDELAEHQRACYEREGYRITRI